MTKKQKRLWLSSAGSVLLAALMLPFLSDGPSTKAPDFFKADPSPAPVEEGWGDAGKAERVGIPASIGTPLDPSGSLDRERIVRTLDSAVAENASWLYIDLERPDRVAARKEYQELLDSLRNLGGGAYPFLREIIDSTKIVRVQGILLMALGDLGAAQAIPLLDRVLFGTTRKTLFFASAYALARLRTPAALATLQHGLERQVESTLENTYLYWSIGQYGREGLPILLAEAEKRLGSGERRVGFWPQLLLGEVRGDPAVVEDLKSIALEHENAAIRAMAVYAIGKNAGAQALPFLSEVLWKAEDSEVLSSTIFALGNVASPEAARPLVDWAGSVRDSKLLGDAATALGMIGSEEALPLLLRWAEGWGDSGAKSEDSKLRRKAVQALARVGGGEASRFLQSVLRSGDAPCRQETLKLLANSGRRALDRSLQGVLLSALESPEDRGPEELFDSLWAVSSAVEGGDQTTPEVLSAASRGLEAVRDEASRRGILHGLSFFRGPQIAEIALPWTTRSESLLTRVYAYELVHRNAAGWQAPEHFDREQASFARDLLRSFEEGKIAQFQIADARDRLVNGGPLMNFLGRVLGPDDFPSLDRIVDRYREDEQTAPLASAALQVAQRVAVRSRLKP